MNGDDLKKWREKNGYTQQELGAMLGVHWGTVNRWENGKREIPPFLWLALKSIMKEYSRRPKTRS